jgi:hypothetical protein
MNLTVRYSLGFPGRVVILTWQVMIVGMPVAALSSNARCEQQRCA